jgi:hypothetical protein
VTRTALVAGRGWRLLKFLLRVFVRRSVVTRESKCVWICISNGNFAFFVLIAPILLVLKNYRKTIVIDFVVIDFVAGVRYKYY